RAVRSRGTRRRAGHAAAAPAGAHRTRGRFRARRRDRDRRGACDARRRARHVDGRRRLRRAAASARLRLAGAVARIAGLLPRRRSTRVGGDTAGLPRRCRRAHRGDRNVIAAIEVRDVFRVHQTPEGDAAALQGLSLTVRERETVTVLGPSGSGKSTFLRILAGLDRPSAGTVRVFGTELGKLPARDVARFRTRNIGYADQHYARALAAELSARELVALELGLAGATVAERRRRADELLDRVGLTDKGDARPAELSGGEQQRVAVAASLAHGPRLFLADEPTGELDAASARLVSDTTGELSRAKAPTSPARPTRTASWCARPGGVADVPAAAGARRARRPIRAGAPHRRDRAVRVGEDDAPALARRPGAAGRGAHRHPRRGRGKA